MKLSVFRIILLEPLSFDRAVRQWIPVEHRPEVPEVADEPGQTTPIVLLWYETQLTHRQLWALPFNEGTLGPRAAPDPRRFNQIPGEDPIDGVIIDENVFVRIGGGRGER